MAMRVRALVSNGFQSPSTLLYSQPPPDRCGAHKHERLRWHGGAR